MKVIRELESLKYVWALLTIIYLHMVAALPL